MVIWTVYVLPRARTHTYRRRISRRGFPDFSSPDTFFFFNIQSQTIFIRLSCDERFFKKSFKIFHEALFFFHDFPLIRLCEASFRGNIFGSLRRFWSIVLKPHTNNIWKNGKIHRKSVFDSFSLFVDIQRDTQFSPLVPTWDFSNVYQTFAIPSPF